MGRLKLEEVVSSLNIIDDTLFHKMAEDIGFCEELLSTILMQKVKIERVMPQDYVKNLQGRSVILDALCLLEDGRKCNVEVQKANDDDHDRRVRYNASCITANITDSGTRFENVPDVICIFISQFDIFKQGKTVYHMDRVIRETGTVRSNGFEEIYVNTKIEDGSDIAELMRIYKEQSAFDFEKFPNTSNRKKQFIGNEGGERGMCEIVDRYAQQVAEDAVKETNIDMARKLFRDGMDYDFVSRYIEEISTEELKSIYNEVVASR